MSTATAPTEQMEQPYPGMSTLKFAMWLFLASEIMFFAGLIVTYISIRFTSSSWPVVADILNVPLVAANTFILIASSVAMVLAFEAVEHGNQRFRYFLLATAVLGIIFLGVQAFEWNELIHEGVLPSTDLFGATFYTLTGFHGLHVAGGVVWILYATVNAFRGGYSENHTGVEMVGLYWHFVDVVWIFLFTILYLI